MKVLVGIVLWLCAIAQCCGQLSKQWDFPLLGATFVEPNCTAMGPDGCLVVAHNVARTDGGRIFTRLSKVNGQGQLAWSTDIGEPSTSTIATRIKIDDLSRIYVSFQFGNVESWNGLSVYSAQGTFEWKSEFFDTQPLGNNGNGVFVSVDSQRNVIAAIALPAGITNYDGADLVVRKLSQFGSTIWERSYSGIATDYVVGVGVDQSDNVYVGGAEDFLDRSGHSLTSYTLVMKYSSNGTLSWRRNYAGPNDGAGGQLFYVDSVGNSYLPLRFKTATGNGTLQGALSYNAAGLVRWNKEYETGTPDGQSSEVLLRGAFAHGLIVTAYDHDFLPSIGQVINAADGNLIYSLVDLPGGPYWRPFWPAIDNLGRTYIGATQFENGEPIRRILARHTTFATADWTFSDDCAYRNLEVDQTGALWLIGRLPITHEMVVQRWHQSAVVKNDAYDAQQTRVLTVSAVAGLLSNDEYGGGGQIEVQSNPVGGSLFVNADGSFTYTPILTFYGTDQFTYRVVKGSLVSNTATVAITVARVFNIHTAPSPIASAVTTSGSLTLAFPVGPLGTSATLSSSNSAVLTVPPTLGLPSGTSSRTYWIKTATVSTRTAVQVHATVAGYHRVISVFVDPPTLSSITISPTHTPGGVLATGTVSLASLAPTGGRLVTLWTNNAAATVPATALIAMGTKSKTFVVTTKPVAVTTTVTVYARLESVTKSTTVKVDAPTVLSLTLALSSVRGGGNVGATIRLTGRPPAAGVTVSLVSTDHTVATVPATLLIPSTTSIGTFVISTVRVSQPKTVTIKAILGTIKTATLTVNP